MGDSLSSIRDEERWEAAKKAEQIKNALKKPIPPPTKIIQEGVEPDKCRELANIQYKKYCKRIEERDKMILELQKSYTDAVFKIGEMKDLLKECLEYVPQPSLIEDIAKIINED